MKVIKRVKYTGFDMCRIELVGPEAGLPEGQTMTIDGAFNNRGEYIGNIDIAKALRKIGIEPEFAHPDSNICSVGFSKKSGKWYGWSHRAIVGFSIGDHLFDENYRPEGATDDEIEKMLLSMRGAKVIKTPDEARQAAVNFAAYIS